MKILALLAMIAVVSAEVINIYPCDGGPARSRLAATTLPPESDVNSLLCSVCTQEYQLLLVDPGKCTIHEIRITPCANKDSCQLTKGQDATIAIDFTPHFSASKLANTAHWLSVERLPWDDLDSDACQHTTCPLQEGVRTTYSATHYIRKKLPKGIYPIEWEFHDVANEDNKCCLKTTVII